MKRSDGDVKLRQQRFFELLLRLTEEEHKTRFRTVVKKGRAVNARK